MANRPPRPGKAWNWDSDKKKWLRPSRPTSGEWRWDDNDGWVARRGGNQNPQTTGAPAQNDVAPPSSFTPWEEINPAPAPAPTPEAATAPASSSVDNTVRDRNRENIKKSIFGTLTGASWGVDLTALMPVIDRWIIDGVADSQGGEDYIINKLMFSDRYSDPTDVYVNGSTGQKISDVINLRFPGWAAANSNGQSMTLSDYRQFENDALQAMKEYQLPAEMYDSPADIAKLVSGRVSINEVRARISTAQTALSSTDPSVVDAFQRYYGVGRNDLLAYMLDGEKGQAIIEQRARTAQVGGSAARYGFNLTADQAYGYSNQGQLGAMAGAGINSQLTGQAENLFSSAADLRDQDTRLSAIDKEDYSANDAVDVAFGDREKGLKSKKRADREAARFSGSSGITASSLSRRAI